MKKGFTLLELLAVVIVLAIIAIITTPVVLNVVESSKKSAFKTSINNMIKLLRTEMYGQSDLEKIYTVQNGVIHPNMNLSGKIDGTGVVQIDTNGNIYFCLNHSDGYYAIKEYSDIDYYVKEGTCSEMNIVNSDKSGATVPEMGRFMVPITWNGTEWIKADIENPTGEYNWYNYEEGKWANAAIVKNIDDYHNLEVGTVINQNDIIYFYVWIPIYQYTLPNEMGKIDIQFISPYEEAENIPHAFYWDDNKISGFWVNKFQLSQQDDTYMSIPNQDILRNTSLSEFINIATNIRNSINKNKITTMNVHVIKNTEWGAISYLSYSKYGVCKTNCTIATNGTLTTGNVVIKGKNYSYDTNEGQTSSTTGNIYGVYDMVGAASEMVVGSMDINRISPNLDDNYYDNYTNREYFKADATLEIKDWLKNGTWYNGKVGTLSTNWQNLIYIRGGNKYGESNIFMYLNDGAGGGANSSTRFVGIMR